MTLILKQLFGFLKVLNSDTGENQIAMGIACGLILGLAPSFSLQTILVITLLFFFKIQIGAAFISSFFFKMVAYFFDPVFDSVGSVVLEQSSLESLFILLYNLPLVPFTKFYNSVVMGAGIISIILSPVIFILSRILIIKYRESIVERLKETKIWKLIKATALYKWYAKYEQLYG